MTREEAEARAGELAAEDHEHSYFAREAEDGWEVVRVSALPGHVRPTGTATEERPRPDPADPRESMERQIGPFGAGGI